MAKLMTKQEFINQLVQKERTDIILLGNYINMATPTLFGCTKECCRHEWHARPNSIVNGSGCPVCANRKLVSNINSVAVLRPDLIKYFADSNDAYNIMPGSHKKVSLRCPDCGAKRNMIMYDLSLQGFSCTECSARISYPNRLIRSIMNQFKFKVDYLEYEWSTEWTERQRYDVYFETNCKKYVIEMQGMQHYSAAGWKGQRTLQEIQDKDLFKKENAINYGIIPIVIDSRQSDFDFIFNNLKNSILNEILDLDSINIVKCQHEITSNIIKQVCEQFENNLTITIKDLASNFNVSKVTITKYLKIGSKIGWCNYTSGDLSQKKVRVFDANKNIIGYYESIAECARKLSEMYNTKFFSANISRACQKGYSCNGLFFEYA